MGVIESTGNVRLPVISSDSEEVINYVKGYAKSLLSLCELNNLAETEKGSMLCKIFDDLYALCNRDNMNERIYFFTRRQKVTMANSLLKDLKESECITDEDYALMKKYIISIKLENFSRQLLPGSSGVLHGKDFKTEIYLNYSDHTGGDVLEPRSYIGIIPEAQTDLHAPSLVTALTPPLYQQPRHDHAENWEITFYTGPSVAKYKSNGKEHTIDADFGDFVLFPPGTWHTIQNPNDFPVENISVKLPSALLDRSETDKSAFGEGQKKTIVSKGNGMFEANFTEQKVPYTIKLLDFNGDDEIRTICLGNRSLLYVLSSDYVVGGFDNGLEVIRRGDAIVLDKGKEITIKDLNKRGKIYVVELHEGREKINNKTQGT